MTKQFSGKYEIGKEVFKEYVLKSDLGEGSYGRVCLVENKIGLPFALKILHKDVQMEIRGIELVMKIRSNRLVSIQDFGKTSLGEDCVLMEYVKDNLEDIIKAAKLSEKQITHYFLEILKGLIVLEHNKIVHRDIKPANLFVLEDIIKIGDFGTAKYTSWESSIMSRAPGSIHYMASERFGQRYDFSVDRWAAAVIFYRMLTGRFVFDGDDHTQIFGAIMLDNPDLKDVHEKYHDFFSKCFKKDVEKRHKSAEEMIEKIEELSKKGDVKRTGKKSDSNSTKKSISKPIYNLRRKPLVVAKNFKDVFGLNNDMRPLEYVNNKYRDNDNGTITDYATGLMWQQSGSQTDMDYNEGKNYIKGLNDKKFAHYSDWRLPTVDELMSLLEPEKQSNEVFIGPLFDSKQWWCWSADTRLHGSAWLVLFYDGLVHWDFLALNYIRAVRTKTYKKKKK